MKFLGIAAGGEFLIMLLFAAMGWSKAALPLARALPGPRLLSLLILIVYPIWRGAVQPLLSFARKGRMGSRPIPVEPLVKETLKLARDGVKSARRMREVKSGLSIILMTGYGINGRA